MMDKAISFILTPSELQALQSIIDKGNVQVEVTQTGIGSIIGARKQGSDDKYKDITDYESW